MRRKLRITNYELQLTKPAVVSLVVVFLWLALLPGLCLGAEYYVDAVDGNDSYPGTSEQPWRTIIKAQSTVLAGDVVFLRDGNYGDVIFYRNYNHGTSWGNHIIYKADMGYTPLFNSLQIVGENAYLEFDGIYVTYPVAVETHNVAVQILDATHVRVKNLTVTGYWTDVKSDGITNYGIEVIGQPVSGVFAEDILVEGSEVIDSEQGIVLKQNIGNGVVIRNNHIHHIASSGIAINTANTNTILIEGNHIHDQDPILNPDGSYSHGCGIALWAKNIHVNGNIIHDFGTTHGIRTYAPLGNPYPPENGYTDMLFENNLIYDTDNQYAVGFTNVGSNFTFRNNTLIGWHAPDGEGFHYYKHPLFIESTASNYDPATVRIESNVIVGTTLLPPNLLDYYQDIFKNNIIYSFFIGTSPRTYIYDIPENIIVLQWYLDPLDPYFEGSGNFFSGGADFDTYSYTRPNGETHGIDLSETYKLAPGSPAIGFGNSDFAPVSDILGVSRDSSPDAGCYEYVASSFLYGDINGNGEVTSYDAALAARYAVGLETFTDEQRQKADVSGNTEVSAYDAALIAQRAVGLIDKFPVEE